MKKWLKEHKKTARILRIICIVFLCAIGYVTILLLTHVLMKVVPGNAEWEGGNIIEYTAGFLSAVAAFVFGGMVYWQTNQANNREERFNFANISRPFFVIDTDGVIVNDPKKAELKNGCYVHTTKNLCHYEITLRNVGEGVCLNCDTTDDAACMNSTITEFVPKEGTLKLGFFATNFERRGENQTIDFKVTYQNLLGFRYEQRVTATVEKTDFSSCKNAPDYYNVVTISQTSPQKQIGMKKDAA